RSCTPPVTIADTVSVSVRLVSTADPLFVTTTRYVTTSPGLGLAGVCVLTTVMLGTGAATNVHTALVGWLVAWHAVFASTTPRLHTVVSTHTFPSTPVTVKVKLWPGTSKAAPLAVHTYRIPPATATVNGGVKAAGCAVACPVTTDDTVSVTVTLVTVAAPVLV